MTSPPLPSSASPRVSVVIPTRGRPHLLVSRALRTALGQTLRDIEVIVVVDGPDTPTLDALNAVTEADARVHVIALPHSVGGGEARNFGIRAARAEWIALLDDDDEWLPVKLEQQLAVAAQEGPRVIVACPWIERTPRGDTAMPPRRPEPGEPLGEYVLARRTASEKASGLVSSLLFTSRDLLLDVPFHPGLPKHQDWDWLLRAAARPGVHLAYSADVGAIWYYEEPRASVSRSLDWRFSLAWAQGHLRRGTMSDKAFAAFLNSHVSTAAQLKRDASAALPLLAAFARARPRAFEWVRFISGWLIPLERRRALRAGLERPLAFVRSRGAGRPSIPAHNDTAPAFPRRVALIDPLDTGHHTGYAAVLAAGLVAQGCQVQVIGSSQLVDAVHAQVPQVQTDVLPLYASGAEAYYKLSRRTREQVNIRFFRAALALARAQDADVVHLLYLDSYTQSFLIALASMKVRLGRIRVRATLHWLYFLRAYKSPPGHPLAEGFHRLIVGLLGALGVRIMVHSRALAAQLQSKVPGLAVDAVPYFAEPPRLSGEARTAARRARRADLGLPDTAIALLAFGGTRHDKGSDVAIRALAELPEAYHLLIVGPARSFDAQALVDLAQEHGVADRVHFRVEFVPDDEVEGYFVAADAVVLPYRRVFAGQSGPLLIAASLGVPVIASDVGVLTETVQAYDLGVLCAPEDATALAEALRQVPSLAPRTQTARFQVDHTPAQFTQSTLESYRAGRR
ncbi:glycosyltransferase [Deinococcus sp. KSM4-11]|uniref:glycosyltransferase n=1 Tax=Deinococcus sp. KSM4-11 TaxID=2568654 RepID=UPI0010A39118|nr:glycosyltransferase [Deinococcus sp. KSM4-11]THF87347.1 glycosyltransferase [Deinococcus sp. KSM4-11]